jgi:hypothetical protein
MNGSQGQIFWITPSPADKVHLDQNRQGAVACTVTSARGPIRARAIIVPQGSARAEWFKLEGPAERFIDGTEQFTVKIAVPAGTKAGDYSFLLKVVSEANPDDEFTEGPQVAFEVPASEPVKKFPWWIVLVVVGALLLVGGGVLAYVLMSGDPELGEACDDGACAEGLVCSSEQADEEGVCLGDVGYEGCDADAEEAQCGSGLVCAEGTCTDDSLTLSIAEVDSAQCLVEEDCEFEAVDLTVDSDMTDPGAYGDLFEVGADDQGVILSMIYPVGQPGTVAEGLTVYVYNIIVPSDAKACIEGFALDFGPIESLDYDGDGEPEEIFMIRPLVGASRFVIGPRSAERTGDRVSLRFAPGVCAGQLSGQIGMASRMQPRAALGRLTVRFLEPMEFTTGSDQNVQVRVPAKNGG